ncbi:MAG: DUF1624 domain-containing protein [Bacteroidetes bacterium]|nr:DUF1624 domain-containing protein [Bacteroidota bacterium]
MTNSPSLNFEKNINKNKRIASIDLLRGTVMIIMALDHVRHFFHYDSFFYEPTDLAQTNPILFFTRFITHYCAPVFVFLAGISAYLYGSKKGKTELTRFLFTRGLWLVFVEIAIIGLATTFNPSYPMFNLQVIWVIGVSMMILSALIHLKRQLILAIGLLLIAGHNLLDGVHVAGDGVASFFWSVLHEPKLFVVGHLKVFIMYPLLPWIGIISVGYYVGKLFDANYDGELRKDMMMILGIASILLFFALRGFNIYGDPSPWSIQKNTLFSILSFFNVTKYPPSLLYALITIGPAMIFLALAERPLNSLGEKISVFGRVPFFYYVIHFYAIHLLAVVGAMICGFKASDMILSNKIGLTPMFKGNYGFNLVTVYIVWAALIFILYPACKWFDQYKRKYQSEKKWLSYL